MRCQNCNNELTEGTTVCPYCNTPVNNQTNDLSATSVLPVTPNTPVLPTDQGMVVENVKPAVPIENIVTPDTQAIPVVKPEEVKNIVQPEVNVSNTPVQEEVQTSNVNIQNNNVVPELNIVDVPKMDFSNPVPNNTLENNINPEYIAPSGEVLDGTKIDGIKKDDKEIKAKKKKKLIIILVIILIIGIIGGLAYYFYYTQYKTSSKRIDAIVSYLTSSTKTLTNDNIEASSGSYEATINVTHDDEKFETTMSGTYAKDLVAGAYDLTINLNSLYNNEDMITSPLNFELYYNDSKVYVLLQNFYENYIYDEIDDTYDYSNQISQNDISYLNIVSALKTAIGTGLKGMSSNQSFGSRSIDGENKRVNILTYKVTSNNEQAFMKKFYNSLSSNTKFLTEVSNITGKTTDEIKNELTVDNTFINDLLNSIGNNTKIMSIISNLTGISTDDIQNILNINNIVDSLTNSTIEVYTSMFKQEFEGIKYSKTVDGVTSVMTVYPVTNGYKIAYKEGSQDILKLNYTKTTKKTSTVTENNITLSGTMYINEVAYTIDSSLKLSGDVNVKSAKVNVKNSINRTYLTNEEKLAIVESSKNIGSFGLTLPNAISEYLEIVETQERNMNLTEIDANIDSCSLVTDCITSNIDGYSICKNTTTQTDVICNNTWLTTTE